MNQPDRNSEIKNRPSNNIAARVASGLFLLTILIITILVSAQIYQRDRAATLQSRYATAYQEGRNAAIVEETATATAKHCATSRALPQNAIAAIKPCSTTTPGP
jgi:hypothetical protein